MDLASQKKSRVLGTCCVLFCVSLSLTVFSARNPAVGQIGAAVVDALLYPFQTAYSRSVNGVSSVFDAYVWLVGVQRERQVLAAKVDKLSARVSEMNELKRENSSLRTMLSMVERENVKGVVARVIGHDPSSWVQAVVVDKGSFSKVRPGMAVTHPRGIIGQVTSVSTNNARVLLVTDHSSGIDSLIQRNRARGVVGGRGLDGCEMKYVVKEDSVEPGDMVVTSGFDMVYPPGLPVGQVISVDRNVDPTFQSIQMKPAVNFSNLEEVLIITGQ